MNSALIPIITSPDPAVRDRSLEGFARTASLATLLSECAALDQMRRENANLYQRVRALFFLYALHQLAWRLLDNGDRERAAHLNRLLHLAFYTGIGYKTTHGLGQVRVSSQESCVKRPAS